MLSQINDTHELSALYTFSSLFDWTKRTTRPSHARYSKNNPLGRYVQPHANPFWGKNHHQTRRLKPGLGANLSAIN